MPEPGNSATRSSAGIPCDPCVLMCAGGKSVTHRTGGVGPGLCLGVGRGRSHPSLMSRDWGVIVKLARQGPGVVKIADMTSPQ